MKRRLFSRFSIVEPEEPCCQKHFFLSDRQFFENSCVDDRGLLEYGKHALIALYFSMQDRRDNDFGNQELLALCGSNTGIPCS